ncbi:DinB family protein [Niveispirillum sp.]|uniref:DinB family protein n=1 Tax=Niveispirillum sp. TaxID=1917217 RepID=UPI001B6B7F9C|nr:DinB family protein [Niveispirillum sp.]MBP7338360.1 DinB family protein [Niveispirillum sp.]
MISVDYVRTMAAYSRWMNSRLMAACAAIPPEERSRDLDAFFKSLHGTLDHILWADMIWMSRFEGSAPPVAKGENLFRTDWDQLVTDRAAADALITEWAAGVTPEWLAAPLSYVTKFNPHRWTLPAWVAVTHFFNHATHHRGQATTLMMQLGVDPGVTDLPALPDLFDGSLGIVAGKVPV